MEMDKRIEFSWIRGKAIGAGSFGTVNLAVNKRNGSLFAVKSVEVAEHNIGELKALENEQSILQTIDSPHVIKCLGGEESQGMKNVFLEYMPGGSVSDLMSKLGGKLDEELVRVYTKGILQGLGAVHSLGIVHCDIKGKNVLVGVDGVKLADFGSSKRCTEVQFSALKGTPLWMAPEVARQEDQGPASDIWSLGCTVLEMLTGKAPWGDSVSKANPMVAMYKIACSDEVPEFPAGLSEQGRDFLSKCLSRDPESRYSAAQLLNHPFVTCPLEGIENEEVPLPSPRSPLDFSRWNSSVSSSELPKLAIKKQEDTECSLKWIVVRSPQGNTPAQDAFGCLSDFTEAEEVISSSSNDCSGSIEVSDESSAAQEVDCAYCSCSGSDEASEQEHSAQVSVLLEVLYSRHLEFVSRRNAAGIKHGKLKKELKIRLIKDVTRRISHRIFLPFRCNSSFKIQRHLKINCVHLLLLVCGCSLNGCLS